MDTRPLRKLPDSSIAKRLARLFGATITVSSSLFSSVGTASAWEIRSSILGPNRTGMMAWHINDRWGPCFDLPTRGLHDFAGVGSQLISGYSYRFFRGADPFPCNEKQNRFYQAVMDFDLSGFRPVSIVSAHLEFQSEELAFNRAPGGAGQTCWFQVSQADEMWRTGRRRTTAEVGLVDTTGPRVFANLQRPAERRFAGHRIDVTRIIARIVNNPALRRQGLVLEPTRNRMNSTETAACVRALSSFRLRVRTLEF